MGCKCDYLTLVGVTFVCQHPDNDIGICTPDDCPKNYKLGGKGNE